MRRFFTIIFFFWLLPGGLWAQPMSSEEAEISFFELEAEFTIVHLASGTGETLLEAPATMVVITAEEIRQRGYTDLAEILTDLPGFDVVIANGTVYSGPYQRGGHRALLNLLMIDQKVDNVLWANHPMASRQYPLTNLARIEILYGPAAAIYGPNAFLGVINLVTANGKSLVDGEQKVTAQAQTGDYNTNAIDTAMRGKSGDWSYSMSAKVYRSDEPDLSDKWGFLSNDFYSSPTIWGPLLEIETNGRKFGEYYDPSDDYGVIGDVTYKGLKMGVINWHTKEGYGAYYAADRAQNNATWQFISRQFYVENEAKIGTKAKSQSRLLYRVSNIKGDWAEAIPIPLAGYENYSLISYTNWQSLNNSWLFTQNFEMEASKDITLSAGLKFERKEMTKNYDVPGYWDAYSSSTWSDDLGPHGFGGGIGLSFDSLYVRPPMPASEMPPDNLVLTEDRGGYVQAIMVKKPFRFHLGVRYDDNSVYGSTINPRLSAIYQFTKNGSVKLVYGEAFQEPSPSNLWGGWNGRAASPDLKPEEVQNLEGILIYRTGRLLHHLSVYSSRYFNVINEAAVNQGVRKAFGVEYRTEWSFTNPIPNSAKMSGYFNYTFTNNRYTHHYNHDSAEWEKGETDLGDIAPHKFNIGLNAPVGKHLNVNLRGNYISERKLYTRNPLRAEGKTIDPYFVVNGYVSYTLGPATLGLKVTNLFDTEYFHPGAGSADSGDDFTQRSKGFNNSLLPQPGRAFLVTFAMNF